MPRHEYTAAQPEKTRMKTKTLKTGAVLLLSSLMGMMPLHQAESSSVMDDQERDMLEFVAGQPYPSDENKTKMPKAEIQPLNLMGFSDSTLPKEHNSEDTYFSADEMINDEANQTITAIGKVNIIKDDM